MSKNPSLVLVESPAKAKLLEKYLKDKNCKVIATIGHLYDLEKNSKDFGIEITDNAFKPRYILIQGKENIKKTIEEEIKKSSALYIATDGDREGEAIGAHIIHNLKPTIPVYRVVFYEIVKNVVLEAFENPREIDKALVKAQEARRILDRIYGFKISKALWKQISYQVSVGRVQSVVLKKLIEREREILQHVEKEVYGIEVLYEDQQLTKIKTVDNQPISITKDFDNYGNLNKSNRLILDNKKTETIIKKIESLSLEDTSKKTIVHSPKEPFNTASIQIAAFTRFGMSNVRTMILLQSLYNKGAITYMRTDSTEISEEAFQEVAQYIRKNIKNGDAIVSKTKRSYSKKKFNRNQREAHEAIRPSLPITDPTELKLTKNELDLYKMIFERTLISQCNDAVSESKTYTFKVKLEKNDFNYQNCSFDLSCSKIIEAGFTQISKTTNDINNKGINLSTIEEIQKEEGFKKLLFNKHVSLTTPKARYNFGSIVKYMKESNIARPSTYSYIINILLKHNFIKKVDNKLLPTTISLFIVQALEKSIPLYIESEFTAEMEKALDDIAHNVIDMQNWLNQVYRKNDNSVISLYNKLLSIEKDILNVINFNQLDIGITPNGSLFILDKDGSERLSINNFTIDKITSDIKDEIKNNRSFIRNLGSLGAYEVSVRKSFYGFYVMLKNLEKKERPKFYPIPSEISPMDCNLDDLIQNSKRLLSFKETLGI